MAQNFLACDRDQELLLPPSLREWLPAGHLAWFVLEAVEALDLGDFYADYRQDGHGRAAHDPAMMVALLLYAYARGDRSSRLIERRLVEDVAFRVIAAGQAPDHATIARFRTRHEQALSGLFSQVLGLCAEAGLVSVGVIALDGTKVGASASGHQNLDYERVAREMLAEADALDRAEDARFGDSRGDELPPELRDPTTRRARLGEARRRLEQQWEAEREAAEAHNARCTERERKRAAGEPVPTGRPPVRRAVPEAPGGRVNLTDPDSRPVRGPHGFLQGYNAQAVATSEQIVIAADVVIGSPDQPWLSPMVEQTHGELEAAGVKERPGTLLADAGYWNAPQIRAVRQSGIEALIATEGQARRAPPQKSSKLATQMRTALESEHGQALYRKRQQIIEPVFAQTKVTRGADRFLRRGIEACRSEWRLLTATHNLLKLWRHGPAPATG